MSMKIGEGEAPVYPERSRGAEPALNDCVAATLVADRVTLHDRASEGVRGSSVASRNGCNDQKVVLFFV